VVTEAELGASAWSGQAQERIENALAQLPRIDGLALARSLGLGALFAAAALFVPLPEASRSGAPPVAPERTLERLEEKLAALEDALALDPELSQELHERLERVEESAREERFDSTFEALDRLEERLDDSAARALEAAQQAQENLAAAASDAHLDHAQEALESALEQLRESGLTKGLSESTKSELGEQLDSLPPGLQLSSQELAALSRELNQSLAKQLGKLGAARLIDPSKLRELLDAQLGEGELDPDHECDEDCKKPGGT
jgi:tetratricopeptide (TPR) repeat protein